MNRKEFFDHIGTVNRYSLLGRMRDDCEYFLGWGGRNAKHLWGKTVKDHIQYMKFLWNEFPEKDKPEWLTMEQIEEYEKAMNA